MMSERVERIALPSQTGEPVWELADLFPPQGGWQELDYLDLETNRLIEFNDGHIEVLPMPSPRHQYIVLFLYELLRRFVRQNKVGRVLVAPLRVRVSRRKFREPDVVFLLAKNLGQERERYWDGADLVMEVVSPDDPQRDLVTKRRDYAEAGVAEYWIVNPLDEKITVLSLPPGGEAYVVQGVFGRGEMAESGLLAGFTAVVSDVFDAPDADI
jgi:Uma2 family endonuclease